MSGADECKLFVAGLPDTMSESVLRQLFEATGVGVVDVSLPRDRATGRARGFGFVTLGSEEDAQRARGELDGTMQGGRSISVRPFQGGNARRPDPYERSGPRPARPDGAGAGAESSVYVGNLPYSAGRDDLSALLDELGITDAKRIHLPLDPQGRPRGFGFVAFEDLAAAESAAALLTGRELQGRRLSANVAQSRGAPQARGPAPARGPVQPRGFDRAPGPRPVLGRPPMGERPAGPRGPARDAGGPPNSDGPTTRSSGMGGGSGASGGGDGFERQSFDGPRRHDGGRRWSKEERKKKKKPRGGGERARIRRDDEGGRRRGRDFDDDD